MKSIAAGGGGIFPWRVTGYNNKSQPSHILAMFPDPLGIPVPKKRKQGMWKADSSWSWCWHSLPVHMHLLSCGILGIHSVQWVQLFIHWGGWKKRRQKELSEASVFSDATATEAKVPSWLLLHHLHKIQSSFPSCLCLCVFPTHYPHWNQS